MKTSILYLIAVTTFKNIRCCPSSQKDPIIIGPKPKKYVIYQGKTYLSSQNLEFPV